MQDHFLHKTSMSRPLRKSYHKPCNIPLMEKKNSGKEYFPMRSSLENSAIYKIHLIIKPEGISPDILGPCLFSSKGVGKKLHKD